MLKRIFRSVVLTAIIAVILTALLTAFLLYTVYENSLADEMRKEAGYIVHALNTTGDASAYFDGFESVNRVTLISPDGTVIYDSTADESAMGNHIDRPEVAEALKSGNGQSMRHSDTLAETTIYYALRTDSGRVLRIANTRSSMLGVFMSIMPHTAVMLACVVLLSLTIAHFSSIHIVKPINDLNLDEPLKNDTYDELAPLMTRMEFQHIEIQRQMSALERARTQLSTITANMREGLVIIDRDGIVLSTNESAANIFGTERSTCAGTHISVLCSDEASDSLISKALNGEHGDMLLERSNCIYQLYISPVIQRGRIQGVVMLILDITERFAAEASRREFTANVSHELKSPLTSISGYAEIIRDGIALPQDIPAFADRIFNDSKRLIALVNDILELSRLDERSSLGEISTVQMRDMLSEIIRDFETIAAEKQISLSLEGPAVEIQGHVFLLQELFLNLIENAVKYTPENGSVNIRICDNPDSVACTVSDTGIGIPKEHQTRIFERFYRVDKSHSRSTGGTGLGLAIVKHAAEIHNASLELDSDTGKGTAITVTFPK